MTTSDRQWEQLQSLEEEFHLCINEEFQRPEPSPYLRFLKTGQPPGRHKQDSAYQHLHRLKKTIDRLRQHFDLDPIEAEPHEPDNQPRFRSRIKVHSTPRHLAYPCSSKDIREKQQQPALKGQMIYDAIFFMEREHHPQHKGLPQKLAALATVFPMVDEAKLWIFPFAKQDMDDWVKEAFVENTLPQLIAWRHQCSIDPSPFRPWHHSIAVTLEDGGWFRLEPTLNSEGQLAPNK